MVCCLCSQHQWQTTIPDLDLDKPQFQIWTLKNPNSRSMNPVPRRWLGLLGCPGSWDAHTEQVSLHTQTAGDLFPCQADAFIMGLISFKFTFYCVLHQSGLLQCEMGSTHPASPDPGIFSLYYLLYIFFNRFSKKVQHSGDLADFRIPQSSRWTDSIYPILLWQKKILLP